MIDEKSLYLTDEERVLISKLRGEQTDTKDEEYKYVIQRFEQ